uniref:Uncharacterized protein n=1 Tax=viral metagenome TaxID=1070528 RepID=A0A6C0AD47_9ZZZZ
MKTFEFLVFLIFFIVVTVIIFINKSNLVYIKSDIDGSEYMVDPDSSEKSANYLANIRKKLELFRDYIKESDFEPDNMKYAVKQLKDKFTDRTIIAETPHDSSNTSYTINKGEKISFCLRSKKTGNLHEFNKLMYVGLHEISHIACDEEGHTEKFWYIFENFAEKAIEFGLYKKIDFDNDPQEYCGMTITSSVV